MEQKRIKYYVLLHLVVFIFGFTAILGKQIADAQPEINSMNVVLYRMFIAFAGLLIFMKLSGKKFKASGKSLLAFIGVGAIIAGHWITFFASIEESNVSVALAVISSTALFTSLIEPLLLKRKFDSSEIILGLATILGIYLITKSTSDDGLNYQTGILLSLISAFLAATFGVLNSRLAIKNGPTEISTVEMISGAVFTLLFLLFSGYEIVAPGEVSSDNWMRLAVLGVVATSFAFVATVAIMKVLTPFTVALSINMEPIYAIIMAIILFPATEKMSPLFYVGAAIIIGTIVLNAISKHRRRRKLKLANANQ